MFRIFKVSEKLSLSNVTKRFKVTMVSLFIDKKPVTVPSYYTLLQACRHAEATVPTFCYHDRLSVAGNCRMCLVEIEGSPKPVVSCAFPVNKDMKVNTQSLITRRAQEGVLELLLINHPLDCPICDQGGECDLQDLAMRYGNDRSRFTDIHFSGKRASENFNLGPLISTEMTRCIHCTRCVRFASQVCGVDVLGMTGRGNEILVGTYVDKMFLSELSGNIIDLCPVGALTNKVYAYKARPWELRRVDSIDVMDATGTNIVLGVTDRVLRVVPRENPEVNQEWLSDKGRWSIDSLEVQRLVSPMCKVDDLLVPTEWDCALSTIAGYLQRTCPKAAVAIAGPYCSVETLVVAKDLLNTLNIENTYVERDIYYTICETDLRVGYSLNINMKDVARADSILLVGTNPRFEAPILNAWIRHAYVNNEADIYYVGEGCSFNYCVKRLGTDIDSINKISDHSFMKAKYPLIFVGVAQLGKREASLLMTNLLKIIKSLKCQRDWIPLHIIPRDASWAGALECGWKPGGKRVLTQNTPQFLLLLGADEVVKNWTPPDNCKVVYVGFQGLSGAKIADYVLPGSAYSESGGTYLNMECRSQLAKPAVTPPGKARYDWMILKALAEYCGISLPYDDAKSLSERLRQISPNLLSLDKYQDKLFYDLFCQLIVEPSADDDKNTELKVELKHLTDYFCTDSYSMNSRTMRRARDAACFMSASVYGKI